MRAQIEREKLRETLMRKSNESIPHREHLEIEFSLSLFFQKTTLSLFFAFVKERKNNKDESTKQAANNTLSLLTLLPYVFIYEHLYERKDLFNVLLL